MMNAYELEEKDDDHDDDALGVSLLDLFWRLALGNSFIWKGGITFWASLLPQRSSNSKSRTERTRAKGTLELSPRFRRFVFFLSFSLARAGQCKAGQGKAGQGRAAATAIPLVLLFFLSLTCFSSV